MLFLSLFIPLTYLYTDSAVTQELSALHTQFWNLQGQELASRADVWAWTHASLAAKLFAVDTSDAPVISSTGGIGVSFVHNDFPSVQAPPLVAGTDMVLVGAVRLRQLRVQDERCSDQYSYSQIASICTEDYTAGRTDSKASFYNSQYPLYLKPAFTYTSRGKVAPVTSNQTGITYPSTGYVVDLPPTLSQVNQVLTDLESSSWIDPLTAAIIVEVNVYHPATGNFVVDRLLFEFPKTGALSASHYVDPIPSKNTVFSLTSPGSKAMFSLDMIGLAFFLVGIYWMIYLSVWVRGRLYTKSVWTYVDIAILLVLAIYLAWRAEMYATMQGDVMGPVPSIFGRPGVFFPLSRLVPVHHRVVSTQAVVLILVFFRGFKFLALMSPKVVSTFTATFFTYFGLAIVSGLLVIGFSVGHHLAVGSSVSAYESINRAFTTVSLSLINVVSVSSSDGIGAFLHLWWIFMIYLLVVPILLAVAADEWTKSSQTPSNPLPNPLLVYAKRVLNDIRGVTIVDDFVEPESIGVKIDSLPGIIRKRVVRRRKELRVRVEAEIGFSPHEYDDFDDWVNGAELHRLMVQDPFVCKVLGTDDPKEVIKRFGEQADEGNEEDNPIVRLQNSLHKRVGSLQKSGLNTLVDMNPRVAEISKELQAMVSEVKIRIDKDLRPLIEVVQTISQAAESASAKTAAMKAGLS